MIHQESPKPVSIALPGLVRASPVRLLRRYEAVRQFFGRQDAVGLLCSVRAGRKAELLAMVFCQSFIGVSSEILTPPPPRVT